MNLYVKNQIIKRLQLGLKALAAPRGLNSAAVFYDSSE